MNVVRDGLNSQSSYFSKDKLESNVVINLSMITTVISMNADNLSSAQAEELGGLSRLNEGLTITMTNSLILE